jgi:choline dehydrogenase-like flavoprotein
MMSSNGFDYDVIVVGSGFGGSVASLRATEKGDKVGVLESGKRWPDEESPNTSWDLHRLMRQPEAEMFGIQRLELLDDVLVLCGAGVDGGSHGYGNTLYVPPKKFFDAPEWAGTTDWAGALAPCIDQASRILDVVRVPYMDNDVDRTADGGRPRTCSRACGARSKPCASAGVVIATAVGSCRSWSHGPEAHGRRPPQTSPPSPAVELRRSTETRERELL